MTFRKGQKLTAADLNRLAGDIQKKSIRSGNNYVFGQEIASPMQSLDITTSDTPQNWQLHINEASYMFHGESPDAANQDFSHIYVALQNTIPDFIPIKYTNGSYIGGYNKATPLPGVICWFSKLSGGDVYGRILTKQDSATNDAVTEKYASKYIPGYTIKNVPSPWIETGLHMNMDSGDIELFGVNLLDNESAVKGHAFVMLDDNIPNGTDVFSSLVNEIRQFASQMQLSAFDSVVSASFMTNASWRLAIAQGRPQDSDRYINMPPAMCQPTVGDKTIYVDTLLKPWDIVTQRQVFFNPEVVIGNYQVFCGKYLSAGELVSVDNIPVKPGMTIVYADLYNVSAFAFTLSSAAPSEADISAYLGDYWQPSTSDYQFVMSQKDGRNTYWTHVPQFYGWMRFI
jgi:hypothetical protein